MSNETVIFQGGGSPQNRSDNDSEFEFKAMTSEGIEIFEQRLMELLEKKTK